MLKKRQFLGVPFSLAHDSILNNEQLSSAYIEKLISQTTNREAILQYQSEPKRRRIEVGTDEWLVNHQLVREWYQELIQFFIPAGVGGLNLIYFPGRVGSKVNS